MKKRILLDCDPGHDDAIAMLLAARHPDIALEAVIAVAGNQTVEKTSLNARKVFTLAGVSEIPIARGMDRPMMRDLRVAADIHGASGLDGPKLPKPGMPLVAQHGVDLIIERALAAKDEITLVATGPLTDVAMAMRREPRIVPKIKQIVLMGGAINFGNTTPAAEFNIYVDPEAAHVVFSCGRPLVMIGLDVTHTVLATEAVRARIRALGSPVGHLVDDLLGFFASTYKNVFGFDAPPLHDPCTVAYVIDPTLFETKPMHVAIELHGEHTLGRTVCDVFGVTGLAPNVEVAIAADVPRFWDLLIETLARYPAKG